jgi:hypothetical protein
VRLLQEVGELGGLGSDDSKGRIVGGLGGGRHGRERAEQ